MQDEFERNSGSRTRTEPLPVLKFRSIESMESLRCESWSDKPGEEWFRRVARLWERSSRINPRKFPPGVRRYGSIVVADEERERWLQGHIDRLRNRNPKPH